MKKLLGKFFATIFDYFRIYLLLFYTLIFYPRLPPVEPDLYEICEGDSSTCSSDAEDNETVENGEIGGFFTEQTTLTVGEPVVTTKINSDDEFDVYSDDDEEEDSMRQDDKIKEMEDVEIDLGDEIDENGLVKKYEESDEMPRVSFFKPGADKIELLPEKNQR